MTWVAMLASLRNKPNTNCNSRSMLLSTRFCMMVGHFNMRYQLLFQNHCCGVNNYTDFEDYAATWDRKFVVRKKHKKIKAYMKIPMTCCNVKGRFPKSRLKDGHCPIAPTLNNSYIDTVSDCKPREEVYLTHV